MDSYINVGRGSCLKGRLKKLMPLPGTEVGEWLIEAESNNYYNVLTDTHQAGQEQATDWTKLDLSGCLTYILQEE